jgi:thiol-disulfide isomerase/thioredoxin
MKKASLTILIALMLFTSSFLSAQTGKLPPFRIMQANGKVFQAQELPMGKPIVVIYFSPECDHCEKMMKEFSKKEASFRKASVAMVTYLPVDKVAKFVQQYGLNKYANIYVGTEGSTFFLKNYYKLTEMPFIALYTKNGDLVKMYRKEGALGELVAELNKLK